MSYSIAQRKHKLTAGIWGYFNDGTDPFGGPVRRRLSLQEIVPRLSRLGFWGINAHDNDLFPFGASLGERTRIAVEVRSLLADNDMELVMGTTDLFRHRAYKEGAFTPNDESTWESAVRKAIEAMDWFCGEFKTEYFVAWGGREGCEVDAGKDPVTAFRRYQDALNLLGEHATMQGYKIKICLEPKCNEPRGDIYLANVGDMLAMISSLDPRFQHLFGVNPEVAHARMCGLNFVHQVGLAILLKKLFHIDLNDQVMGRFDQDLAFGSHDMLAAFNLLLLLDQHGYDGPRNFDAHCLRTENESGIFDFAQNCVSNYLMLLDKVQQFKASTAIQTLLQEMHPPVVAEQYNGTNGAAILARIRQTEFDYDKLGARACYYEALSGLVTRLLLGKLN
jgi:xylose isomerase